MKKLIIVISLIFCVNVAQGNTVKNYTDYQIDSIIFKSLKCLQIENVVINIRYLHLDEKSSKKRFDYKAISYEQSDNFVYIIFISPSLKNYEIETTILHELIHVQQFYSDRLNIDGNTVIFEDKIIKLNKVGYRHRAFEIEAHNLVSSLLKSIKKL